MDDGSMGNFSDISFGGFNKNDSGKIWKCIYSNIQFQYVHSIAFVNWLCVYVFCLLQ